MTTGQRLTIDAVFSRAAENSGDKIYLEVPAHGVSATFAETMRRARQLAGAMRVAQIGPGDRVACMLENRRELYEFFIAASLAGAVAVPINVQSPPNEVSRLLGDCQPKGIVAAADIVNGMTENPFTGVDLKISAGGDIEGFVAYDAAIDGQIAVEESLSQPTEPCLIIYSSGTTGAPKGIVLCHERLLRNALGVINRLRYSHSDVFLAILPSFHLFGYSFDFLYSGIVRGRLISMPAFSPDEALTLIEANNVSILTGVPTQFARMFHEAAVANRALTSLRLIDVGGGPVSPTLKTLIETSIGAKVVESYGLTEISTVAAVADPDIPVPEGSCGPVIENFSVRVVDEAGSEVAIGESGELWFQCDTFMHEYLNQPKLTAATIQDGWLRTGDIGKIDEEGNLYILDRKKDMIVSNGFNVFPKEVENACLSHPAVLAAGAVGLPDEIRGQIIHVVIVLKPGVTCRGEEVLAHCAEELARYKRPRGLTVVDNLPLTASGKIRRYKLRELALESIENGQSVLVKQAVRGADT